MALASAKIEDSEREKIWHTHVPNLESFPFVDFFSIGFSHHRAILSKVKSYEERVFIQAIKEPLHSMNDMHAWNEQKYFA